MLRAALIQLIPAAAVLTSSLLLTQSGFVHKPTLRHRAALAVFALYIFAVFDITGIPDITTAAGDADFNLVPFADLRENAVELFLNVLLFLPAGVMLPLLWREFRPAWRVILFGFALSLAIELLQMCNFRTSDVDDLIANTAGAAAGWLMAQPLLGRTRIASLADGAPQSCGIPDAVFTLLIVFLYTFFIAPNCAGLWRLLSA